jgi:hypothetical protein
VLSISTVVDGPGLVRGGYEPDLANVKFTIAAHVGATTATVVGGSERHEHIAMTRQPDGSFSATARIPRGQPWLYQFEVDGERRFNDVDAEDYVVAEDGSVQSMVIVR